LVFIRHKKIKGHLYAYLVRNRWDKQNNKVKQEIVKYLGNSSKLMLQDIPREYQNDPNIVTFISTHTLDIGIIEGMESSLMDELLKDLMNHDIDRLIVICEKYSRIFGLAKFYERVLTPVMYKVGNMWAQGIIDVAMEHVCSNAAHSLVTITNEKFSRNSKENANTKKKILLCTPEGELHSLGCMVIESVLINKGYSVINIAPSVPSISVISFVNKLEPDLIIISITLVENLRPAKRLIHDILESKGAHFPILVGGNGTISVKKKQDNKLARVKYLKNIPLSGILLNIKESLKDNSNL
jgi:methanogenic corrinoid protein MtbC1